MRVRLFPAALLLALTPTVLAQLQGRNVDRRDGASTSGFQAVANPRVESQRSNQLTGTGQAKTNKRAEQVKQAFLHSWTNYKANGLPQDEVKPVTGEPYSTRNGWGASAVDALSTAIIMDLKEPVNDILKHIKTVNYARSVTNDSVSLFETTIRYLGGMLSGYDLLREEARQGMANQEDIDMLLKQSVRLANALSVAFNTPSGIPYNDINPEMTAPSESNFDIKNATANLAQAGTLILEWTRLADLTKNATYAQLVEKMQVQLMNPRSWGPAELPVEQRAVVSAWPGLVGFDIYVINGTYKNGYGTWGGGADSYYEYLIKMWLYDAVQPNYLYRDRWIQAVNSSRLNLRSYPIPLLPGTSIPKPPTPLEPNPTPVNFTIPQPMAFIQSWRENRSLINSSQHLACFTAGNILLGASVLDDLTIVNATLLPRSLLASPRNAAQTDTGVWNDFVSFGLELLEGCHYTYTSMSTQIGPERYSWRRAQRESRVPPYFKIESPPAYILRPEVMESYYYAYRITGQKKYQDWAWDAFLAIERHCKTKFGFSSLVDVNVTGIVEPGGSLPTELREKNMRNEQESFWFAETLKYAYLAQQDGDEPWHVPRGLKKSGKHQYVYNTEAHPLRVRGTPV